MIAAAGNDNYNNDSDTKHKSIYYPASYDLPNIISVGAIDKNGDRVVNSSDDGSNYGATTVDLFAPGQGIYTTLPDNQYTDLLNYASGTSMAAPHVAGVAALIYAKYPCMTANKVKSAIMEGVDKLESLNDLCVTGGKLNAYKALVNAQNNIIHSYNDHYTPRAKNHIAFCACGASRTETHVTDTSTFYTYMGKRYAKCTACKGTISFDTMVPTLPGDLSLNDYNDFSDLIFITNTSELIAYFRKSDYYDTFISYCDKIISYFDDKFFDEYVLVGSRNATETMIADLSAQVLINSKNYFE